MAHIVMPTPHRPASLPSRHPTTRTTATTTTRTTTRRNSFTDDEDAITPCSSPPPEPNQLPSAFDEEERRPASPRFTPSRRGSASPPPQQQPPSSRKGSAADVHHHHHYYYFDPTDGEPLNDAQLWRRMLAIQQEFHCYNSARMSAALLGLEMGVDVEQLAPSRRCLDLMNESMSDMAPEEMQRLTEWLHENSSKRKKSSSLWRRSTASSS